MTCGQQPHQSITKIYSHQYSWTWMHVMYLCFLWAVILVAHFLQSVSSGLVLGGELVYHRGRAEEGGILTLAGQYSSEILFSVVNLP